MHRVVIQHVFGTCNSGGPVVALDRIFGSGKFEGYEFHRLQQVGPAGGINLKILANFRRTIKKIAPDMIHVRGLGNEGFHGVLAARLAGVPRILLSIHGSVRDLKFTQNSIRHALVRDVLEPLTLRMATQIVTVCEFAAHRDFLAPYQNKFVGVVPNGVDLPVISEGARLQSRRELGISDDEVVAVCVSRLTYEKGYLLLAEALRGLPPLQSPLKILVVGDGPDRVSIEKNLDGIEKVETVFLGHRNEVDSILCAADLFIFPSLHENLSNALLEAMSHGLPVVATAVGGNKEVLARGGGVLVSVHDPNSMGQSIARYVNNEIFRKKDGGCARIVVEENYTTQHMANRLKTVYQNLLD